MFTKSLLNSSRLTIGLFFLFVAQPLISPIHAQTSTPTPKRLAFEQTVSGQLRGKDDTITYTVDVPPDQDVLFAYRTTKFVSTNICFFVDAGGGGCAQKGGGGSDGPLSLVEYVATHGKEGQQAVLTLTRPLDEVVSFQLTAYAVTPQPVELGERITVEHTGRSRFQIYSLTVDARIPFTVTTEDEAEQGSYLWAAHQPFATEDLPPAETQLINPVYIDSAAIGNHPTFTSRLFLYNIGGDNFRVVVEAGQNYMLSANTALLPVLEEGQSVNMSVSYRQPIWVVRLNTQTGENVKINFEVTSGAGAIARVYQGTIQQEQSVFLGAGSSTGSTFPLMGDFDLLAGEVVYAVVQIPFEFTRETVNVEVTWQGTG